MRIIFRSGARSGQPYTIFTNNEWDEVLKNSIIKKPNFEDYTKGSFQWRLENIALKVTDSKSLFRGILWVWDSDWLWMGSFLML